MLEKLAEQPLAAVVTLGCKVNQFESSSLTESLSQAGYRVLSKPVGADLVVVNTCTVTHKADQEALSLLRRLRRQNPQAKIVATGCLAQVNPELLAQSGLVDLVLGQNEKASLISQLTDFSNQTGLIRVAPLEGPARDFGAPAPERTRAFYKIQDGCSAFCAYCAVPLSRGPSRSLELEAVLDGLRNYLSLDISEVVLCGIHLGQWGHDLTPRSSLAGLLHAVASDLEPDEGRFRLRLSSIEPLEFNDDLFEAYEMYPWLANHLHLPLQSGSDRILELMGRPYRIADFRGLVDKLKTAWPLMSLGVDVMVGFPGESETDFIQTKELLSELPLSYFHIFPYSKREGTRAAASPDQVPEALKKQRAAELKVLNEQKRAAFSSLNIGQNHLGLVENTPHLKSGRQKVLTGNYLYALLPEGLTPPRGQLLPLVLAPSQGNDGLLEAEI